MERTLRDLQTALDSGQRDVAIALIETSACSLSNDQSTLMRILERLDRQRKDELLEAISDKLQKLKCLPVEALIFDLRAKFRTAHYGAALEVVDRILAFNDNIEALRIGGRIGNITRDKAISFRYWKQLALAFPSDAEAPLQLARIQWSHEQYGEALHWAKLSIVRRPDDFESVRIAVSSAIEVGWQRECDALLVRFFQQDRDRALPLFGRLAQELDVESAAHLMAFVRHELPADHAIASIVDNAIQEWLAAAAEKEQVGERLAAALFYRAASVLEPDNCVPQRALAKLNSLPLSAMREALDNNDFESAVGHGEIAVEIDPRCFEGWKAVGQIHFILGNISEARQALRRCTELDDKDAQTWLTYGLVLDQAGEAREALSAFKIAAASPDSRIQREADMSISMLYPQLKHNANQAAANGNIEAAWQSVDAGLSIRPDDAQLTYLRRELLKRLREQIREAWNASNSEAVALCESYLKKAPDDMYALMVMGRTLMKSRAYAQALPVWESICHHTPQDAHPFLQIARCCRSLNLPDRGVIAARRALELAPGLREAEDLLAQPVMK